jgi:hypothetical protein
MTHRSRQLSDDAKPPPREAVFRFGDKVERNLEQEREATMTKAPSPTTSLTPEEKSANAFSRSGATQCGTPKECFDVFPIRKQRGQRRCGEICCDQQSERCRRKGCSGLSKPTRKLFLQPSCGCWPGGATWLRRERNPRRWGKLGSRSEYRTRCARSISQFPRC